MFQEEDYIDFEQPAEMVEIPRNGCTWMAYLLERRTGGFDLFYDHENSLFKPLALAKITILRHMTERGENFIAYFGPERDRKRLVQRARDRFLEWIVAVVGD